MKKGKTQRRRRTSINITEIVRRNPKVDRKILRESMALREELERLGLPVPRQRLATPFRRRRVITGVDDADPRMSHLPRLR